MGYIDFDKKQLVNLEYSLGKEILRTSRSGSYSSTTIVGCNTRKYHGLLVSPVDAFDGESYVLLSALDVSVAHGEKAFNLGLHKFDSDHYSPKGHKYLVDFSSDPVPSMVFEVGMVRIRQERVLSSSNDQVFIRYTLENSTGAVRLQFKPLLAFRRIHDLTFANLYVNRHVANVGNGVKIQMYEGFPFLNMQFSKETEFISVPDWIKGVQYPEEQARGYDYIEDLYKPGYFETVLKKGESIVFSASTEEVNPAGLKRRFAEETKERIPRDSFRNCLINSAQQFIVNRGGRSDVIAGYHWFGSWGRDTFISLPGLTLSIGDKKTFRKVMDSQVKKMHNGLFPNMGTPGNPAFNSVDAPLWFIWAVQQYYLSGENDAWKRYGAYVKDIISSYHAGTSFGIGMHDNGLIFASAPGKALTWMDAITVDGPVTPRAGYNVEINALWYNAICFGLDMSKSNKDKDFMEAYSYLPEKIRDSYISMFWLEKEKYLADFVDENGEKNTFVRPNMIFAVSMPNRMLKPDMEKGIVDRIECELLTSRGLRTLSPKNILYKGLYKGNQYERDSAYHQGTVWPWLCGHFCEAWLNLYGAKGLKKVMKIIYDFEDVMGEHGISTISEVYDGDPPHSAGGTISQAWSVAELLRIMDISDHFSSNEKQL